MDKSSKVFLAGHRGMLGSAIHRLLEERGYGSIVTRSRQELDLTNQTAVGEFIAEVKPDVVILCAAKVGGIVANKTYPADFITENLKIQTNVICSALEAGTPELEFISSSCVYPRLAPQPMKEEFLWSGPLEPTNAPYAAAKLAGMQLCEAISRQHGLRYFSVIPPNIYGPGDHYDLHNSHVLPALIRKFHEAKEAGTDTEIWGTGSPLREFIYVDDAAEACVFLLESDFADPNINIGTGVPISIRELALLIQEIVGHTGSLTFDSSKPDGFPEKVNDISLAGSLGWSPKMSLENGIRRAYSAYLETLRTSE